jgi:DNA-binding transcriptional MerR regulator
LRYYERINILSPAYVDEETGYRYYSLDQIHLVAIIMFCVELDIPLKGLPNLTDEKNSVDFDDFLDKGKQSAKKKIKSLQKGLRFIDKIKLNNQLIESRMDGKIYSRTIPEKIFYVKPCGQSLENVDVLETILSFADVQFGDENIDLPDYGFLCKNSPTEKTYYAFVEVSEESENTMRIPGEKYFCKQVETGAIEQAPEIFSEYLRGRDSFIVIEAEEFYVGKRKKNNSHISELRII